MPKKTFKLSAVIRSMINNGFNGNQKELMSSLSQQGIVVSQATISRTLKKLGAIKSMDTTKQKYHFEAKEDFSLDLSTDLKGLITSIDHNEVLIVIKTKPGSAMFIAGFIDHNFSADVLGTVAGDDSLFIAPRQTKKLGHLKAKLDAFF